MSSNSAREEAEAFARASESSEAKLRASVMARLSVSGMASEEAAEPEALKVAVTL